MSRILPKLLAVLALVLVVSLVWSGIHSFLAIKNLRDFKLEASSQAASRALPVVLVLNQATFHQIPDIQVWYSGLKLLQEIPAALPTLPAVLDHSSGELTESPSVSEVLTPWLTEISMMSQELPRTWVLRHLLGTQTVTQISDVSPVLDTLQNSLLNQSQTWLILFQNSDELRATGGFAGSLALVSLHNGSVTQIEVQDIYQPDGQFHGFTPPPPGVSEYLSGGNGWRLPDLNWSPDFPTSAHTIHTFFADIKYPEIAGVVSLNLEVAQRLLEVTGGVYLPEYQITVTPDNLNQVLRQDRDQFFPGSLAKQQLLASFFTHFKLRLSQVTPGEQLEVLEILRTAAQQKEIQVFAINPDLQKMLLAYDLAGQVPSSSEANLYIYPIESNVGINKANQGVERHYELTVQPTQSSFKTFFTNSNTFDPATKTASAEAKHLHYVNYQRFLLKPETQVTSIRFNGQDISSYDQNEVTLSNGETFKQIGFLITTLEQQPGELEVTLTHPQLNTDSQIVVGQQSGIHPRLTLDLLGHKAELDLTQDLITTSTQLPQYN